jgi:hypothetical protein
LKMSGRPPAPSITLLKNNTIDLDELGSEKLQTYALYDNPRHGDGLYPSWWGRSPSGEPIDYANGDVLPIYYDPDVADPVLGMPMEIDNAMVHRLDQGEVFYSYLLERFAEEKIESYRLSFYVGKRDFLPAPQIKECHDEHLDVDDVGVSQLTVVIPPHRAMATGDKMTLRWAGERFDGTSPNPVLVPLRVTDAHVGNAVSWQIARSQAVGIRDGKVRLSYTIEYASPTLKPAATSATREIVIKASATPKLEKIRIKGVSGDELDPDAFSKGITFLVEPWPGMRNGDILILYWTGNRADRSVIKYQYIDLSSIDTGKIEIHLEQRWLLVNNGLSVSVTYQCFRADASGVSEPLALTLRVPLNLPKPAVEEADYSAEVDGELDTQHFSISGVMIDVPPEANIAEGDSVTMHWKGFGAPVEVANPVPGHSRKFNVPAHAIPANMNRVVEIYYSVRTKDAPVDAPASLSKPYFLKVLEIPQGKLGVIECDKVTIGNPSLLKRSDVPPQGVQIKFRPVTWIYIAEVQEIRMWLTAPNVEEPIIAPRKVTLDEVTGGVRGTLLPIHLQSIADGTNFSIRFSVSFNGGETHTPFRSLPLQLRA